ncbi:acyl-CoA thioesterase [bacterium]
MSDYQFTLSLGVRDYECDLQGIVNNGVYQNYLEHARHEFLKELGLDFAEFVKQKINLVVLRIEIDYKYPLVSGDKFFVGINLVRISPVRFGFIQDIYRLDKKPIIKAKVIGTALNERGRPSLPKKIEEVLQKEAVVI